MFTKVKFILPQDILPEFLYANKTSIYENSELNVSKKIKFLGKISNNWPKDLLWTSICKSLEACWERLFWQYYKELKLL